MNRLLSIFSFLLALCATDALAQSSGAQPMLEASVERQTVIDGESVLLYIKGEHLQQLPDVSALTRQFDVLDSRRSNSQVVEDGVIKSQFLMRFELLPKHLGQTTIPAFTADGISTQPIVIEVVERGTPGAVPRDKVFAEVTLDKDSTYVQAQVVMSLHILDDGSLASVDPPVPVIPDVQVEQLPGGDQRIEARNGEEYRVHTWRYALFPQKQGDIEIPRLQIPGSVRDPGYGGGLIMRSMATRRIQIRTSPVTFTAAPRNAASTAQWWLPVESLQLQHQWSAPIDQVIVGEPLTLTLALTTRGATSNQLPAVEVPDLPGLKIYPDVPALQSQPSETGLISQRQEKWSVIPQRAGELTLPAVTVKWWDTTSDVEREATLPSQTLVVAADPNQPAPPVVPPASQVQPAVSTAPPDNANALDSLPGESVVVSDGTVWRTMAVFALFGWLATACGWIWHTWQRRRQRTAPDRTPENASTEALWRAVQKAAEQQNQSLFRERLMAWAQQHWPDATLPGPMDIATRLQNPELTQALRRFEASLYSSTTGTCDTRAICRLLRTALDNADTRAADRDYLPSL